MTFRHRLRARIVAAFALFGAVLAAVYAGLIYYALHLIEDETLRNRLELEVAGYLEQYAEDQDVAMPADRFLTGHRSLSDAPERHRRIALSLGEGYYEVEIGDREYHLAVFRAPGAAELSAIFYDVTALETLEPRTGFWAAALTAGFLVVVALGLALGMATSGRVIAPLRALAQAVSHAEPRRLPTNLAKRFADDEVGLLANALDRFNLQVNAFVDRERQFTRNASHELRTPVTVVKGAAELIASTAGPRDVSLRKPLQRITRAVKEMENVIETFLWLGRQGSHRVDDAHCRVGPLCERAVEQHAHLLEGKPVEAKVAVETDLAVAAPSTAVFIAIGNLVRNAFLFTESGEVKVTTTAESVVVADTGRGIPADFIDRAVNRGSSAGAQAGYGLGLAIVRDFCQQYGWSLGLESESEQGTRATLRFSQQPNRAPGPA